MISYKRKKLKNILLYSLTVIIIGLFGYFVLWENYIEEWVVYSISGKQEKNIISVLKVNGAELPYDQSTNTFFCPVHLDEIGKEKELHIEIIANSPAKFIIENETFYDQITIQDMVDFQHTIKLYANSSFYYNQYDIQFTNLPIINISNESKEVDTEYIYGSVSIIDPNYEENESEYFIKSGSKVKIRGASSALFPKKSYKIRLYEENRNKNLSLLGLREDSDWILDPLYTDDSRVRTKLSYDIWNKMNQDVNEEYYATLNCQFVEIFMGNEYMGLYLLKEPIDEDTVDLKKTSLLDSGILVKGTNHDAIDFSEDKISHIQQNTYYGLEIKYPKNLSDNEFYWKQILSKMKDYYTQNITDEVIQNTFYLDNILNYRLFILALGAIDNYEPKNVYFSLKNLDKNTRLLLTPWDLDLTFGLEWNDDILNSTKMYQNVENIVDLNVENSPEFAKQIKNRWKYLRENVLKEEEIEKLLEEYYEELTLAGAIQRDSHKWEEADLLVELEEIKVWCIKRFQVIDQYIEGL